MKELVYDNGKGQPITDSLRVAMKFKKEHKNVLRDIQQLFQSAQNSADLEKRDTVVFLPKCGLQI